MNVNFLKKIQTYIPFLKKILFQYWIAIIGIVIILCGQCMLGIFFILTSFFIRMLIFRLKKDTELEETLNTTNNHIDIQEPFAGAIYVSALGVCCTGNIEFTSMQMYQNFSKNYSGDWTSLCRIAFQTKNLNQDLIVECLASKILKANLTEVEKNSVLVLIFGFLSIVEYNWSDNKGIKPSVYLAELLQKPLYIDKHKEEDLENAYKLLGLTSDVSIEKIKSTHRYLVGIYHPDTLSALNEEQQKTASETFLRIQHAYEKILEAVNGNSK